MDRFLARPPSASAAGIPQSGGKRQRAAERGTSRASTAGSKFSDCPICGKSVAIALMSDHMDSADCHNASSSSTPAAAVSAYAPSPPTLPVPTSAHAPRHASVSLSMNVAQAPAPPPLSTAPPSPAALRGGDAFAALRKGAEGLRPRRVVATLALASVPPSVEWASGGGGGAATADHEGASSAAAAWTYEHLKGTKPPVRLELRLATAASLASAHPALMIALQGPLLSSKAVLISALQKNVRLCRPASAVRVAYTLLRMSDPVTGERLSTDLLRRLPIIAVEDSLPPPLFPALVWLMAAHSHRQAPIPLTTEMCAPPPASTPTAHRAHGASLASGLEAAWTRRAVPCRVACSQPVARGEAWRAFARRRLLPHCRATPLLTLGLAVCAVC